MIDLQKYDSYAQRQHSVFARDIAKDRIENQIKDMLPSTCLNMLNSQSRTVFKKKLIVGSDPAIFNLLKKKQLKIHPHVFEASNQITVKELNKEDDVSRLGIEDLPMFHLELSHDD